MPVDTTQILYKCPLCDKRSRDKNEIEEHINNSDKGRHKDISTSTLDYPIEEIKPQFKELPLDEWKNKVLEAADKETDKYDDIDIIYTEFKEKFEDIPDSFIAYILIQNGYNLFSNEGKELHGGQLPTNHWRGLTANQKDALLLACYHPNKTNDELADMDLCRYEKFQDVQRTIDKYYWMFLEPTLNTPIEPINDSDEGEIITEIQNDENDPEPFMDSIETTKQPQEEDEDEKFVTIDLQLETVWDIIIELINDSREDEAKDIFLSIMED